MADDTSRTSRATWIDARAIGLNPSLNSRPRPILGGGRDGCVERVELERVDTAYEGEVRLEWEEERSRGGKARTEGGAEVEVEETHVSEGMVGRALQATRVRRARRASWDGREERKDPTGRCEMRPMFRGRAKKKGGGETRMVRLHRARIPPLLLDGAVRERERALPRCMRAWGSTHVRASVADDSCCLSLALGARGFYVGRYGAKWSSSIGRSGRV